MMWKYHLIQSASSSAHLSGLSLCVQHMSKTDAAPLFESCSEGGVMTAHTKGLIKRKKQTEETNVRHLRSGDLEVLCDKSNLTVVNFTFSAGSSPLWKSVFFLLFICMFSIQALLKLCTYCTWFWNENAGIWLSPYVSFCDHCNLQYTRMQTFKYRHNC